MRKMKKNNSISSAELEIMEILWESKEPLKIQEICDRAKGGEKNYSTVATLIGRLKEKGAVSGKKDGKSYYYQPTVNKDKYVKSQTRRLIQRLYHGSVRELAASLFKSGELTKEDLQELRKLLDE